MLLAAATLATISTGPAVAESLQHNAVAKHWLGASSAEYDPENKSSSLSMTTGLAAKMSYKCSVDFRSFSVVPFQVEDGNTLWPSGSQTSTTRLYNKKWTTEQLQQEMTSTVSRQQMMNDKMDGIGKARALTIEIDTPQPPSLCDLEDLMLPVNALVGAESTMRVWDSGATSGMT